MRKSNILPVPVLAISLFLSACDFNGGVEQGRCVAFDAATHSVTLVVDTAIDAKNPHYSGAVDTYKCPTDPRDMGPEPTPGGLLMLEPDKNRLLYFDPESRTVKEMNVKYLDILKEIPKNSPQLKGKAFPIVDRGNRAITVYSPRLAALVTFQVSPDDINLPLYTWEEGDEVRIAFRRDMKDQAIRFMNVSKTSIFSR